MTRQFLTDSDLAARYGISRATVWRWTSAGRLPPPIRLGEATTRWPLEGVLQYEQKLAAEPTPGASRTRRRKTA
jgi:prophage regulatory protein